MEKKDNPKENANPMKNIGLLWKKESKPRAGLRRWNPYEFMTLVIGTTLIFAVAGWFLGDMIFTDSSGTDNDHYTDSQVIDDNTLVLHVSPLTINNFAKENDKIMGLMVARPPNANIFEIQTHEVASGESLWTIAHENNITLDTLLSANSQYQQSQIHPGTILRVPSQDGIFYKVESGKTIDSIAKQFSVGSDKILAANNLTVKQALNRNQEIFIPGAKPKTTMLASRTGFGWPAAGRLTSGFGYRMHPMGGGSRFHRGVDIAAEYGTTIVAAQSGKVVHAGWYGLMGKTIIIQHTNGYVTYYAHSSRTLVQPGQWVKKGQAIALVGSTGLSTGPHVHFEVRRNGVPINPMRFLR